MYQTLCIIVLFAVSASAVSVPEHENSISEKCKIEYNLSEEFLNDLRLHPEHLFTDPTMKCLAACILIENKTLKPDGTLDAATLIKNMPMNIADREKVAEAFNACANVAGVDKCERAHKTVLCINGKEAIRNIHPSN